MDTTRTSLELRAHWRGILLLVLILWFLLSSAFRAALAPSPGVTGIDFQIYYDAANRLNEHQPLYVYRAAGDTYVYSPALAIALQPLARLPYPKALELWFFLTASCLGSSVLLYSLAARFRWRDLALISVILILGFRFWPSTMTFSLGQANFVILLLVCGMFLADSRKNLIAFAILVACAAAIKTWMIGMLLYPLLRQNWRATFVGAFAFVAILAAGFSIAGWSEWAVFSQLTAGYANQSIGQIAATQSIPGFAYLHFGPNRHLEPLITSVLLSRVFVLLGLGLMFAGCAYVWKNAPSQPSYEARLQLGLVILSLLLLLPMCQSEYFVLCLPLLWTLLAPAPVAETERRLSLPVLAGSFCVYILFTRGWPINPPIPEPYRHGLKSLLVSADFFGALALWFITLYALRRARVAKPATPLSATLVRL